MAERGDMVVLHEPFCNLRDYGETDAGGRTFGSPLPLLAWLRSETQGLRVFLKDHALTGELFQDVLADRRFLAGTRHAFLIRRPEEIAASSYALHPGLNINAIGLERLCELQAAVREAGADASVSSTLMTSWPGPQRHWRRTARPSGCPSSRGRLPGSPANGPNGAGPPGIGGPLPDRGERPGPRGHRRDPHGQQSRQRMPVPAPLTQVRTWARRSRR
jgi:hypothetical protein